MQLPIDITIDEMRLILKQVLLEYNGSEENYDFVDQLDERLLRKSFDLLGQKDPIVSNTIVNDVQQEIEQIVNNIAKISSDAYKIIMQHRENVSLRTDSDDLLQMENQF